MNYSELISDVKLDLGIEDNSKDEVIELYLKEGEKQLKNYLGVDELTELTSTLLMLVKKYATQKMKENNCRYNARVERRGGLDNYFKDYKSVLDSTKKFVKRANAHCYNIEKNARIKKEYAIQNKVNRRKNE